MNIDAQLPSILRAQHKKETPATMPLLHERKIHIFKPF